MTTKTKSMADIYDQWNRIFDNIARRDWDGKQYRREYTHRQEAITAATRKYVANIARHFGNIGFVSNADFVKPVPRNIYAA